MSQPADLTDPLLETSALTLVPVEREPQQSTAQADTPRRRFRPLHLDPQLQPGERVLYRDPVRDDIVIERGRDGMDYRLVCARHQWASAAVLRRSQVGSCPYCVCEGDERRGRERYAALQSAVIR